MAVSNSRLKNCISLTSTPTAVLNTKPRIMLPGTPNVWPASECFGVSSTSSDSPSIGESHGHNRLNLSFDSAECKPNSGRSPKNDLPLMLHDPGLPAGWHREVHKSKFGAAASKIEVYIIGPSGERFRSRNELRMYFIKHGMKNLNAYGVDFSSCGEINETVTSSLAVLNSRRIIPAISLNNTSTVVSNNKPTIMLNSAVAAKPSAVVLPGTSNVRPTAESTISSSTASNSTSIGVTNNQKVTFVAGKNAVMHFKGFWPGQPESSINMPLTTLRALQTGQCIHNNQSGYLLVKNEPGKYKIRKVVPQLSSTPQQQHSSTPQQQYSSTPQQQHFSLPQQQHSSSPQQHHFSTPQQHHSSTPLQQHTSTPQQHHSNTPQQQHSTTAQQQHFSTPQQHHSSTPQQQHSSTPQQQQSSTPQQQLSSTPQQQQSSTPQQHHSSTPQQQLQQPGDVSPLVTSSYTLHSQHHTTAVLQAESHTRQGLARPGFGLSSNMMVRRNGPVNLGPRPQKVSPITSCYPVGGTSGVGATVKNTLTIAPSCTTPPVLQVPVLASTKSASANNSMEQQVTPNTAEFKCKNFLTSDQPESLPKNNKALIQDYEDMDIVYEDDNIEKKTDKDENINEEKMENNKGVINEENNHVHQKEVISERESLKENIFLNIEEINGNRILRNVTAEEALAYFCDDETNENRILRNVTAEEAVAYFSR